jgi:uncharacterized GH25 family protein
MKSPAAVTFFALLTLVLPVPPPGARAHDFWIEPPAVRAPGSSLPVRLRVGEHFSGEAFPRDPTHIARFVVVGPDGEAAVPGIPGRDPAGHVPVDAPGLYTIGYRSQPRSITTGAAAFEAYLAAEGLEHIIRLRAERGVSEAPATERFSRCAKALVAVGDGAAATGDTSLDMPLELFAERNPSQAAPGDALAFRLLHEGRPLAGALVIAHDRGAKTHALRARTDASGRVAFRLPHGGAWLVKSVHMIEASPGSGADWESLWASLTFELPG